MDNPRASEGEQELARTRRQRHEEAMRGPAQEDGSDAARDEGEADDDDDAD